MNASSKHALSIARTLRGHAADPVAHRKNTDSFAHWRSYLSLISRGNCTRFERGLPLKVFKAVAAGCIHMGADEILDRTLRMWDGGRWGEKGIGGGCGGCATAGEGLNRSPLTFTESERRVVRVWRAVGTLFPAWWTEFRSTAGDSKGKSGFQRGPETLSVFENPRPGSKYGKEDNAKEELPLCATASSAS